MLTFEQIIERTASEIEILKQAPIGSEVFDMEIEDEAERKRLIEQALQCLEDLRKSRPAYVVASFQKRTVLFDDNFM